MTAAKAIRIINALISEKVGNKNNIERYRWSESQKEMARKMMQEDIDALRFAKEAIKAPKWNCKT